MSTARAGGPEQPPGGRADVATNGMLERALSQAVRTPLHSLMGFLELLGMSGLDDDQRRLQARLAESAEELLAGSDRVTWLLRVLGGHYRPRPARVYLGAFAGEVAAASDRTVSAVVAPDAPPHLETDLAALHQLVTELLDNARRHGSPPVVLAVSPAADGPDQVRITVSDGGAGLPAADRGALVAAVAAGTPTGGLGFVLVGRLAGLLGGSVEVLPSAAGTHVAVTLPLTAGTGRAAPVTAEAGTTPRGSSRPLRVLLVEDNATNRLLTERQLTRLGHSLTAVDSGAAGVRAVLEGRAETPIDVVLMDRHLPDIDGCEATLRIRAGYPDGAPYLPILGVTADATGEARDACAAAGMDEVLTKPVDLDGLAAALDRAAAAISRDGAEPVAADPASTGDGRGEGRTPSVLRSIAHRVDGDPAATAALVATYLGELPGRRLRIHASLRRGETRAVLAAAESLRTSSDTVGASAIVGACAALGAAAADGDLAAARAFLPSLVVQCEHFAAELEEYTDSDRVRTALAGGGPRD